MELNNKITVKNCVKYIIFAGVTYTILKIIPTKQLSNLEILSLVTVILLGIISLECLTVSNNNEHMTNTKKLFDLDMDVDIDFNTPNKSRKEYNADIGNKKDSSFPDNTSSESEKKEKRQN